MQVGSVPVKVYTAPSRKRGVSYVGYVASFWIDGKRYRVPASTLEALADKVKEVIRPLVGENDTLLLRGVRLRAYERAASIATQLGLELDEALQRLSRIQTLAASKNCSIEQTVEYWARHHDQSKFSTPTPEVADRYLDDLRQNGNTDVDILTARSKVMRFTSTFGCPLRDITREQYRGYFKGIGGSARNRKNHRDEIRRFTNWARDNDYLPGDHPGSPRAGKVKVPPKRIEVFTEGQREDLIRQARPVELPMTLIKAFIPIRPKEAGLACWEDIDWDVGIIMVWGDQAKTKEPRPMRLPRALRTRLRPLAKSSGRIYPFKAFYKVGPRLARKAGIKWIRNGWRTTTISHLQAVVGHKARVAEEAGTSEKKMKTNYLKYLRPTEGRAYFGLNKGELHPVEHGYDAEHYSPESDSQVAGTAQPLNVIAVQFDAQCG